MVKVVIEPAEPVVVLTLSLTEARDLMTELGKSYSSIAFDVNEPLRQQIEWHDNPPF